MQQRLFSDSITSSLLLDVESSIEVEEQYFTYSPLTFVAEVKLLTH